MWNDCLLCVVISFLLLAWIPKSCSQGCQDLRNYWTCYSWMQYGYCDAPEYRRSMYRLCQRTCNFCHIGRRLTTTTPAPTTPPTLATTLLTTTKPSRPEDCKDQNDFCVRYKSSGYCDRASIYYQFMSQKCPKTCGFCKGVCKDNNVNCPKWTRYCVRTGEYWNFMQQNCARTCKLCDDETKVTGGKEKGSKEFACNFEEDFCQWTNEHHNDEGDWKVGVDPNGPATGADGSSRYSFLDTAIRRYKGRLILPWVLVMPVQDSSTRTMCFTFKYSIRDGSLKIYEQKMPSINEFSPKANTLLTLDNVSDDNWQEAKIDVTLSPMHMLYMEGMKTKQNSHVAVDEFAFYNGSC